MRYLILASFIALAACAGTPQGKVFEIRAGYDAAILVPMARYAALPTCTADVVVPVCKKLAVLTSLRKADLSAKATLDAAEDVVRNHPGMDAGTAIAAAQNAVSVASQIIATYGIK